MTERTGEWMNETRTEGKWTCTALKSCPLPGYGYDVKAHAPDGAVWPVALFVSAADAESVCDPDGWEKRYLAIEELKDERDRLRKLNAELLAALKRCHSAFQSSPMNKDDDWITSKLAADIRAAIAKA